MKVKRFLKGIAVLSITALFAAGCGKKETPQNTAEAKKVIKLGINGDENEIWRSIGKKLAEDNIELKIISFSDYIRPNLALHEGEIDANAFQTEIFFEKFKADHKLDLVSLGYTVFAPMGIYSKKIGSISELAEGSKVAIPNDASNGGRALHLLQDAGIIKIRKEAGLFPTVKDITENTKNIKLVEMTATQIPRSIEDVAAAVINNGVAVQAGYAPLKDSIFIEKGDKETAKNYFNLIAVAAKDKDNPTLKKLLEHYQTEENKKVIDKVYSGASIPAF